MFKIKGFYVFALIILSFLCQPLAAQKKDTAACYGQGQEVVNNSLPCCEGLERLTEVNTKKIFCDKKPGASSVYFIWGLILIFPFFLFVFLIFGIRNKMVRKNKIQP